MVAVAATLLYAAGAAPTIYVGDSGELVTAAYTLGIPHPPGYALYVLLGRLWIALVPAGEIAWRMSLMSAVAGGAACGVLHVVVRREGAPAVAALTAAGLLAGSPSFWGEANVPRVYTLNALFLVIAIAAAQSWRERPSAGRLAWMFFVCGLGATNHLMMALVATALVPRTLWRRPGIRRPRDWAFPLAAFAAGLSVYAYLPLRSRMDPILDWGDPETLARWRDVLLRRDFWERAYFEAWSDLAPIALDWLRSFATEITWAGVSLASLGAAAGWRGGLPALAALVMAANLASMAFHGSRSDLFIWHRYYVPSYAMAVLLAGLGTAALVVRLPRVVRMLPLLVPAWLLVTNYRAFDRSRYEIAEAFSRAVLRVLPPGATLIATDDNVLFVLIYLHHALGLRPDVQLVMQGVGGTSPPPLRFDPRRDPVFFTHHPNWNVPGLAIVPRGLVFQAWRDGIEPPPPLVPLETLPGEDDPRVPKDYLTRNLIAHLHYMLALTYEERDWLRARRQFARAAAAAPDNDVLFYNMGLIYGRAGLLDEAEAAFARCHAINPRHLASQSRPRASDRLAEIGAERARLEEIERALRAADPTLAGAPRDSPAAHRRLAGLLAARGETAAARGHALRAVELTGHAGEQAELDGRHGSS